MPRSSRNISTCPWIASGSSRATPIGSRPAPAPAARGPFPIGAVMVNRASQTLAASLKELAADKLEAAVADLEIARRRGAHRRNGPRDLLCRDRRAAVGDGGETDGGRVVRAAGRDLSERHARLRGRDRSGNRGDDNRPLHRRRRFWLHAEPAPARGAGSRRHRAGRRVRR